MVARVNGVEIRRATLRSPRRTSAATFRACRREAKRDTCHLSGRHDPRRQGGGGEEVADTDFKRKLAFLRNKLLMETLLQTEGKAAVTDEAMRKVYDEAVKQMASEKEVRARHILVETEDEAKAILAELKKGADFAELAKEKSKDPGAAEGGDLGYFTKDQMVPEFAEVAFKLEKGQMSDPVKTQFGWHIIKVEDKRTSRRRRSSR